MKAKTLTKVIDLGTCMARLTIVPDSWTTGRTALEIVCPAIVEDGVYTPAASVLVGERSTLTALRDFLTECLENTEE